MSARAARAADDDFGDMTDVAAKVAALQAQLQSRLNGLHQGFQAQIDQMVAAGAQPPAVAAAATI